MNLLDEIISVPMRPGSGVEKFDANELQEEAKYVLPIVFDEKICVRFSRGVDYSIEGLIQIDEKSAIVIFSAVEEQRENIIKGIVWVIDEGRNVANNMFLNKHHRMSIPRYSQPGSDFWQGVLFLEHSLDWHSM
jgi:uncharacterized linocin/CFP29 family protein